MGLFDFWSRPRESAGPQSSELRKAVYFDPRYGSSWVEDPERVARNLLEQADFRVLDAFELADWLKAEIARGADGAVCVLAQGAAPDTVYSGFGRPLVRRFMDAGGRLVWIGDAPFWCRAHPRGHHAGDLEYVGPGGMKKVLGLDHGFDIGPRAVLTEAGKAWGLTQADEAARCVRKSEVTEVLSESGPWAASWFKNFNQAFPRSGFLRVRGGVFGNPFWAEKFQDLLRAALHGYPAQAASAEGEVLVCDPRLFALKRAVYYDRRFPTLWVNRPEAVAETLRDKGGFSILGADEFGAWLESQAAGGAAGSVCLLSQGVAPETAAEVNSPRCLARRYLDAGGRMVWVGDIPFYYQGRHDGAREMWIDGSENILGLEVGMDVGGEPAVTEQGKAWGLSRTGLPQRCARKDRVTEALSVTGDWAASWFKNYNPAVPKSGFLRYLGSGLEDPAWAEEVLALAVHDLPAVPAAPAGRGPAAVPAAGPVPGALVETGAFSVDREAALRKIMRFQLPDASQYLLPWTRAAVAGGALSIDFEVHDDRLTMRFDGEAFPAELLAEPYQGLLGGDSQGPRARHLAVGLLSVLRFSPEEVAVASGKGAARHRLRVASAQAYAVAPCPELELRNEIVVRWGESRPDAREHLERLRAAASGCRVKLWVHGRPLAPDSESEQSLDFDFGEGVYGRLWVPPSVSPVSVLDAHVLGVKVASVQARFALAQVRGWINDDAFSINASQSGVTRNLRFHRTIRRVAAQAELLLWRTAEQHGERLPQAASLMIRPGAPDAEGAPAEVGGLFDYWKDRFERGPAAEEMDPVIRAFRAVGKATRLLGGAGPCRDEDIRRVWWDARVTAWLREAAGRHLKEMEADLSDPALRSLWKAPLFLTAVGGAASLREIEIQRRSLGFVPLYTWSSPAVKRPPFLMIWCPLPADQEALRRRFGDKVRDLTYSFHSAQTAASAGLKKGKFGVEAAGFNSVLARAGFRFQGGEGEVALTEDPPARRARLYAFDGSGRAVGFKEKEGLLSFEAVYRPGKETSVDDTLLSGALAAAEEAVLPLYRELGRIFQDPSNPRRYYSRKHLVDHLQFMAARGGGRGPAPEEAWLGKLWLLEFAGHGRSCANLLRDFRRRWSFHLRLPSKYWMGVRGREILNGDASTRPLLEALLPGAVFHQARETGLTLVFTKPDGLPPWETLMDAPGRELELIEAVIHQAGTLPDQPEHPARLALVAAMTRRFYGFPGDVPWPWRRRLLDLLQQLPLFRKRGGGTVSIFEAGRDDPEYTVSGADLDLNPMESALVAALWPEPEKGAKGRRRRRPRSSAHELEGPTGELLAGAWNHLARFRGRPGLMTVSDLLAILRESPAGRRLLESALDRDLRAAYLASVAATGLNRREKRLTDLTDIDFQRELARSTAKGP